MFWSKIWFFVIALVGAVVLTVALVLPRPAQRTMVRGEINRLRTACSVIHILLADEARNRVDLAGAFARSPEIMTALEAASAVERLDEARMRQVRDIGDTVMKAIQGARKPDFAMLIDRRGRVVARVRLDENDFGDVAAGRPLIDDALAGYLRDDLWASHSTMFFVSAAPVVKQGAYAGAVVLGHKVTTELATTLVEPLAVDMAFHLGGEGVASSSTIAFDHTALQAEIGKLGANRATDCETVSPIQVRAGAADYTVVVARLPGEAAARQAYYSVMIPRPGGVGLVGSLRAVNDSDLSFDNFPWILVGGAFLVVLAIGIGLMYIEVDRPLRRLTSDAVRLAKGETERMSEDAHAGRLGSVARSVNIHIDKLGREAKSAKKDLDQLLGPAPEGSLGTIDLLATALPTSRPGGPAAAVPPPPSEFRFHDSGSMPAMPVRQTPPGPSIATSASTASLSASTGSAAPSIPPGPATPPSFRAVAPPSSPPFSLGHSAPPPRPQPAPSQATPPAPPPPNLFGQRTSPGFDDDILGPGPSSADASRPRVDPYFKQIFDQFVSLKKSCNEPTAGLVYEKFAEKLVKNRDDLMMKTGCREVRFTVYVKDGKAALKATPVKDEA